MQFQLVAVGIKEIERRPFRHIVFENLSARVAHPLGKRFKLQGGYIKSHMGVLGQRAGANGLIDDKRQPQRSGLQISAAIRLVGKDAPPHIHIKPQRPVKIGHRQGDVVNTGDHPTRACSEF